LLHWIRHQWGGSQFFKEIPGEAPFRSTPVPIVYHLLVGKKCDPVPEKHDAVCRKVLEYETRKGGRKIIKNKIIKIINFCVFSLFCQN